MLLLYISLKNLIVPGFLDIDRLQFERVGEVQAVEVQHLDVVEVQLKLLSIVKLRLEDDVLDLQVLDGLKVDGNVGRVDASQI